MPCSELHEDTSDDMSNAPSYPEYTAKRAEREMNQLSLSQDFLKGWYFSDAFFKLWLLSFAFSRNRKV